MELEVFIHQYHVLDDIPAFEIDNNEMLESISHGNKVRINSSFGKISSSK